MTTSDQELADEQLDAFLLELNAFSSPSHMETIDKEPSLDDLINEIFELTTLPSPSPAPSSLPTLPLEERKKNRSYSIIWVTAILLFGLLTGSAFGFYWAKSEGVLEKPIMEPQEKIASQITRWIKELNNLYEMSDLEEIIEPLESPTGLKALAPSEMT